MPSPLENVEWERCLVQPRHVPELETYVKRRVGNLTPATPFLSGCPWLLRLSVDWFYGPGGLLRHIDQSFADCLCLTVSQENSCRHCYSTHRLLLRIQGMSEARIQDLGAQLSAVNR